MKETDALRGIAGVSHFLIRANDEDTAADTIPAHTLAVLVQSGNANRIVFAPVPGAVCEADHDKRAVPFYYNPLLNPLCTPIGGSLISCMKSASQGKHSII